MSPNQAGAVGSTNGTTSNGYSTKNPRPAAADELIKKVPPYRPPGAVVPSGINTLVNPLLPVNMHSGSILEFGAARFRKFDFCSKTL